MTARRLTRAGLAVLGLIVAAAAARELVGGEGETSAAASGGEGVVVRVVDGDTVHVRRGSGTITVRLALVDAPELSALRRGHAECGGQEATDYLERLVDGERVSLRRPGGQDRDRYGRYVRELVHGGRSVDERLIRAGWATSYRVPARAGGAAANRRTERVAADAKQQRRGVWALCGGFGRPAR